MKYAFDCNIKEEIVSRISGKMIIKKYVKMMNTMNLQKVLIRKLNYYYEIDK